MNSRRKTQTLRFISFGMALMMIANLIALLLFDEIYRVIWVVIVVVTISFVLAITVIAVWKEPDGLEKAEKKKQNG